jgi:hypothetical protein
MKYLSGRPEHIEGASERLGRRDVGIVDAERSSLGDGSGSFLSAVSSGGPEALDAYALDRYADGGHCVGRGVGEGR